MSTLQRYKLRGLNLRDSNINRNPEYASDVQNVELNAKRELVKRFGYDDIVALTTLDIVENKKTNELLALTTIGLKKENAGAIDTIGFGNTTLSYAWTVAPSHDEYAGISYFTDPALNKFVFKYDGDVFYRAGMYTMKDLDNKSIASGSANYFRYYYSSTDAKGNTVNGDYFQIGMSGGAFTGDVETLRDEEYRTKYGIADLVSNNPLGIKTSGDSPVVATYTPHNVLAGNYITIHVERIVQSSPLYFELVPVNILVTNVSGDDLTLDISGLEDTDQINFTNSSSDISSIVLNVFHSTDETFGYEKTMSKAIFQNALVQNITFTSATTGVSSVPIPMEDVYDTTIVKGEMPKCKYIAISNNIMILANSAESVGYNAVPSDSFRWSDTGIGSTVETFPPFNFNVVGKSSEGPISGIKALSDNIVIGKEKQIYYLNGNLVLGSYRIRSALTNGIGCVSHRSMYEIEGGCIFMSSKGLYLAANGQKPLELSDLIEPYFRDLSNLTGTKIVNDILNEKLLIYIPETTPVIVVYDYYYKEWFIHKGIDADSGIAFFGNDLYHCDNTNLYKRSTSYNDDGDAIEAFYRGAWENLGFPSVVKKFKKLILLVSDVLTWNATVKTYNDWDSVIEITNETRTIVGPMVDDISLKMTQKKAMRVEIGNNVLNEGMLLSGFEIEVETTQLSPKGES